MKMKIKKISIIILCVIFLLLAIAGITLFTLSVTTTSYNMQFNKPSRIIVYYENESGNQVFEPTDTEYNKIYSLVCNAYKQSTLNALTSNQLYKDVKIIENDISSINFSGININFVYDTPQVVRYKNKMYITNNENYWYQNLIFDIVSTNKFQYTTVAIIPPNNASNYYGAFNYSLYYKAFANWYKTYNYTIALF